MKKLIVFAIAIFGFTAVSFGQTNTVSNATATAKVIKALTLTNPIGLDFGTFSGLSTAASTVVLATNSSRTGSTADLLAGQGGTAASFTITGEPDALVTISLPAASTSLTSVAVGSTAMTIASGTWVTNMTDNAAVVLTTGTGITSFLVGATLAVGINQTTGTYNGTYAVTVNYN
jgi:hypothetical protein